MNRWQTVVEQWRRAQTRKGREQSGLFSLEGWRLYERAVRADIPLQAILISESTAHDPRLATLPISPQIISDALMKTLTEARGLGDILAIAVLPSRQTISDWYESAANIPTPLFLIGVDIVDAGNVGALIRTGHALGITAFVSVGVTDPFHPRAVRTSMGSLFKTTILSATDLADCLAQCRRYQLCNVGAVSQQGIPLHHFSPADRGIALYMGNEYHGLSPSALTQLDQLITIPMQAGIDSFSINAATAIILYALISKRH